MAGVGRTRKAARPIRNEAKTIRIKDKLFLPKPNPLLSRPSLLALDSNLLVSEPDE